MAVDLLPVIDNVNGSFAPTDLELFLKKQYEIP